MSDQWIFIQPNDVWFFRDNKPFSAGQNFVARGQFPPNPTTVQGAVRTYYLEQQGVNWEAYKAGDVPDAISEMVGLPAGSNRPASQGQLRIQGPYVGRWQDGQVELLYRAPLDLLQHEETASQYALLKIAHQYDFLTDAPFEGWRPLIRPTEYEQADGWLTQEQFARYLRGDVEALDRILSTGELFQVEDRVGLGLDYGRRANRESQFYRAEFIRPCEDVGLVIRVNNSIFEEAGILMLGGESRSSRFQQIDTPALPAQTGRGKIRIVLLTPAYFTDGWRPVSGDWSRWVGETGRLVSLVVGKPVPISGWDIANGRPKPLRNYVPAGSVFYFEDAIYTGHPFTEPLPDGQDAGAMGFGTCAIGTW
jgi:CRISPR-associated protein Cmr3